MNIRDIFLALALYGPAVVAIVSVLTTVLRMRHILYRSPQSPGGRPLTHPWRTLAAVLALWTGLSAAAVLSGQFIAFIHIYAAAHAHQPITETGWATPFLFLGIPLLLFAASGEGLFRLALWRYRVLNPAGALHPPSPLTSFDASSHNTAPGA